MLGFVKKDLAMIRSNIKIIALLIIFYIVIGFNDNMDISFILPFMSFMIMISTFSYDEFNKWDAYASTLPSGRKNNVKSKYLTTLLILVVTTIIVIILSFLISYIHTKAIDYQIILLSMLGNIFATLTLLSFMYPIIFKFGIEKARIAIFIIVFGIVILGGILLKYVDLSSILNSFSFMENYAVPVIIILSILFIYISYIISLKIQLKKEY